jgi:hypothetical protein
MPEILPSPATASTFAVKETSFPLSSESIKASDGELGYIKRQSSSSKPRARRSLLKELNLASLSELDKTTLFCLLYKLTDTHLNPTAQSAMKVNLAAQVMSHTVAAGLSTLVATGKDHCTVCYELFFCYE